MPDAFESKSRLALVPFVCITAFLTSCPDTTTWSSINQLTTERTGIDAQIYFNWNRSIAGDALGSVFHVWRESNAGVLVDNQKPEDVAGSLWLRVWAGNWNPSASLISSTAPRKMGYPAIATARSAANPDNQHVYIVFHEKVDGDLVPEHVYLIHGKYQGSAFSMQWDLPFDVAQTAHPGGYPSVAAFGDEVHVVWNSASHEAEPTYHSQEVYLRTGDYSGTSPAWKTSVRVSAFCYLADVSNDTSCPQVLQGGMSSWTASVAADATRVHVAWTDERHNLRDPEWVGGGGIAGQPFDCDGSGIADSCREEEYYRRFVKQGNTYTPDPEIRLTYDRTPNDTPTGAEPRESWAPSVAVSGNFVHVVYFDRRTGPPIATPDALPRDGWQIYHHRSTSNGDPGTWNNITIPPAAPPAPISTDPNSIYNRPSVAAHGATVAIAYSKLTMTPVPQSNIYARISANDGGVWDGEFRISDPAQEEMAYPMALFAQQPSATFDAAGRAHFVWLDRDTQTTPRSQIFYRRRGL
jgi:hypothetical protein